MNKPIFLTKEGYKRLEAELEELKTVKRKEVSESIKTALSFGDLSENSEYDEAKNQQAIVESRIIQIENDLKKAQIIDEDEVDTGIVNIGSKVEVKDMEFGDNETFYIVSSVEVDPLAGKISNESPVGEALLGKKVGEVAQVHLPDDVVIEYQVLTIGK